ncbi:piggyBac transposable element-derived protein 4-like [Toxotes jaculatrix]|uniref:piggyBac transposable element-derived protein 4-like n=1 Tax=Toxotes jaculatrix TaxID=941984 RepID=UPI001B3A998E|nr:piggyBac transposable element-derived protein 4-like [Toxotes jaculatrix]
MDPRRAERRYTWQEAFELITASDEDGAISAGSSGPDSADSEDEANFIDGIDPAHDIVDEVGNGDEDSEASCATEAPCTPERGRGRGRSLPPAKTGNRPGSEAFPGDVAGWKTAQEPDSLPHAPLHFLPRRRPGVQPPLTEYVDIPSPSELFGVYFDRAAVKTICANTNKNAAKHIAAGKKFKWTELTEAEFHQYIGITLFMGILKLPKLRDYWRGNTIFHVGHLQKVMSRDRFLAITWNLHMSDPAKDTVNDSKKGTTDYDCLHRIRPLYDHLRVACKSVYHPQRNLSVDERMVATKARIALKQYIKNKPTKWGIKLFVLSDNTGYTVDFFIYTGRSTPKTGKGLSFDAVMSLVQKSFLGSGYHIYCDNFYTSPALFRHLHDLGFGACGTFRDTQVGIPHTKVNALTKNSPRGTIRWIREGPLLFIKWMDTREVSVCSTLHTAFSGDSVRRVLRVSGKHRAVEVPLPSAVKDYNKFMGGVDLSDQLIGSYSSWRKTRKWYLTVLHHFVDIAVTNSYLLHKELCGRLEQRPMTHQAFQEQLTAELCGVQSQPVRESTGRQHIPVAICEGALGSKKATRGRRKCRLCGKCTPFMCEACEVPLCVIVDRNCHKSFHSS